MIWGGCLRVLGGHLEGLGRLSGGCEEAVWSVLGGCLEGIGRLSGCCGRLSGGVAQLS